MSNAEQTQRRILLLVHTGRAAATDVARTVARRLLDSGLSVVVADDDQRDLRLEGVEVREALPGIADDCEVVLVIGGDGTILRAAEMALGSETPLLGINLGHVGFLAEAEWHDVDVTVDAIIQRDYTVEDRMTIRYNATRDGQAFASGWALNDISVEKAARQRMLELVVEIDGRPLSRWGCDGLVFATPTGSTAYAFSAGGPVVWPEVEAVLLVPISAHALFARPMVTSPNSVLAAELLAAESAGGVLWCDGRRTVDLPPGARIEVRRGEHPVHLARLEAAPFTSRLVAKFDLPVSGWRGAAERRHVGQAAAQPEVAQRVPGAGLGERRA